MIWSNAKIQHYNMEETHLIRRGFDTRDVRLALGLKTLILFRVAVLPRRVKQGYGTVSVT